MKMIQSGFVKRCLLGICFAGILALTGCANQIPEMTAEQSKAIGEYAAVTLLKYDANHRSRLVDQATIDEYDRKMAEREEWYKQEPEQVAKPETMKPTVDTPVVGNQNTPQVSSQPLSSVYALPQEVNVQYLGCGVHDSYPDDGSASGFLALDASAGNKLLVLEFELANGGGADVSVDFFMKDATFALRAADGKNYQAMTTMLMNDLSTYIGSIPAGGSEKLVLLFEAPADVLSDTQNITLNFKQGDNACNISL